MAELDAVSVLPWLKRLQGDLDDDDSSDSSTQQTNVAIEKVARKTKPEKPGENRRHVEKRFRQQDDKDSDAASTGGVGDATRKRYRRIKKLDKSTSFVGHKDPVKAEKTEQWKELKKSPTKSVGGNTLSKQAMAKLPQSDISKSKRQRVEAIRPARGKQKNVLESKIDSDKKRKQQRQARTKKDVTDKAAVKRRSHRTELVAEMENKIGPVESSVAFIDNNIAGKKQEEENAKLESNSLSETTPGVSLGQDDKTTEEVRTQTDQMKHNEHNENNSVVKPKTYQPIEDNEEHKGAFMKPSSAVADVTPLVASCGSASSVIPEKEATSFTMTSSSETVGHLESKTKEESKTDSCVAIEGVQEPVDKEDIEKQRLLSPRITQNLDESVRKTVEAKKKNTCDEKEDREDLVPESMISSNEQLEEQPAALSSVGAFVIPKRSLGGNGGLAVAPPKQKKTGESQANNKPLPVIIPPLGPSVLSPKFSTMAESIRPSTKRSKQPVALKSTIISTQDQALMRLSKKRNSILMAAAELAAQIPGFGRKKGVTMGYEVFDIEGNALSDLIPRLSCVTKREMTSKNRDSYAVSFFGVSIPPPKAKEIALVELEGSSKKKDCDTRKLSCYEELRFKRLEDREFYQRKMYGAAFVPQKLRGWITLIVRNACFERKSTGIRFNQDRDREEFAALLSKRYTLNNSIPRCDIPRENWQKLQRNQPGCVYLHYYNREDAEKAAQAFRDDLGHPLELKKTLKAGVVVKCSLSPATEPSIPRMPRRSHSSERSGPASSPFSLPNGSARKNSSWRQSSMKSDDQLPTSRWHGMAPQFRNERRYDSYDGPSRRSCPLGRSRSRSRSRSKSFHGRQDDVHARGWIGGQDHYERNENQIIFESDGREWTDRGVKTTSNPFYNDVDAPARKRARPYHRNQRQFPSHGLRTYEPRGSYDDRGDRWQQGAAAYKGDARQRREISSRDYPRGQHCPLEQRSTRGRDKQRSRSRSRQRTSPTHSGRGGEFPNNQHYKRQRFGENERPPALYDDRFLPPDRQRGDHNGRREGGR